MPKHSQKLDDVADDLKKRGNEAMQSFGRAALETGRGPMATLAGVALLGFAAGIAASVSRRAASEVAQTASGDWIEALIADHRQIETLFEQILTSGETDHGKRAKLFKRLDRALARHSFAEETVVYPTLGEAEAEAEARDLARDHFDFRAKIHAIEALERDDPDWSQTVRSLHTQFMRHAEDEETVQFPALRDRLSPQQNAKLTRDLAKQSARLS
jgi:hemerythrin superfamily protein